MDNIMSSKLFTTRQGTVLLGVIAAIIAAIVLIVYLNNYRSSVVQPPVGVLVAQKLIQQGTSGDVIRTTAGYYTVTSIPHDQVETGAIVNPETLANQVATTDISPGQQLTASDFGNAGSSVANKLAKNERAVVVNLESPNQGGGEIAAGDHVDVWVAFNGTGSSGISRPVTKLLYQDMTVLNVASSGGNVTLEGTPMQAGTLIFASENATIWLTLRPTVGSVNPKPPLITTADLLSSPTLKVGH